MRTLAGSSLLIALVAAMALTLPACGKKKKASTALGAGAASTAQAPPRAPAAAQDPLEDLQMDPRVQFPQERAPQSRPIAQAVATLASAIAQGDSESLESLLDPPSQEVLRELVEQGQWQTATSDVQAVRVVALEGDENELRVGLGVQDPEGAYLIAWAGRPMGDRWIFSALPIEEQTATRAVDLDGVAMVDEDIAAPGAVNDEPTIEQLRASKVDEERADPRKQRGARRRSGSNSRNRRGLRRGPGAALHLNGGAFLLLRHSATPVQGVKG